MAAAKKPEPARPGDEQIAREEIEDYYTQRIQAAGTELQKAQARFDRVQAEAAEAIEKFRAGARLSEIDAWSIELHAGNTLDLSRELITGRTTDPTAYENGKARREATERWLRAEGYEPIRTGRT